MPSKMYKVQLSEKGAWVEIADTREYSVHATQEEYDAAMLALQELDFKDLDAVLSWLWRFHCAGDSYKVQKKPGKEILEIFARHGFFLNPPDAIFDLSNREKAARGIIGNALAETKRMDYPHQIVGHYTNMWKHVFPQK